MLVWLLILLGAGTQLWLFHELRYDLPIFVGGSVGDSLVGATLYLSPALLAAGGAVLARWLHRRRSACALLAVGIPGAVLLLGLTLGVIITANPVFYHQP